MTGLDYNTQRPLLRYSEYGRNVQEMVAYLKRPGHSKEKRTELAKVIVSVMASLNPGIKETGDYKHKLWDHLYAIADFDLDIDAPYPAPQREVMFQKPDSLPYPKNHIRFRFYGRNVQNMIMHCLEIDSDNQKKAMINLIASFMRNSCRSWNNENLTEEAICEHISILSAGKLAVLPEDITILYQTRDNNRNQNANFQNNRNKNFKDNRNRRNGGKPKNNFRNK